MSIESKIRAYIGENFLFGEAAEIGLSDSFLDKGIIDSTGILEIVAFLESEFGVDTADEDLAVDNFGSIATIVKFVLAKQL